MNLLKKMAFGVLAGAVALGAAQADEDAKDKEPSKLDKALAKYERTGEMKRCLSPSRIRRSTVVDDNHIIFEVSPSKRYLSTLPHACNGLGFHRAIKYTVRGGSICKGDLFQVFDSISIIQGPTCSFGEFEKLERKKEQEPSKEQQPDKK